MSESFVHAYPSPQAAFNLLFAALNNEDEDDEIYLSTDCPDGCVVDRIAASCKHGYSCAALTVAFAMGQSVPEILETIKSSDRIIFMPASMN
jgi:hypothetical protein